MVAAMHGLIGTDSTSFFLKSVENGVDNNCSIRTHLPCYAHMHNLLLVNVVSW